MCRHIITFPYEQNNRKNVKHKPKIHTTCKLVEQKRKEAVYLPPYHVPHQCCVTLLAQLKRLRSHSWNVWNFSSPRQRLSLFTDKHETLCTWLNSGGQSIPWAVFHSDCVRERCSAMKYSVLLVSWFCLSALWGLNLLEYKMLVCFIVSWIKSTSKLHHIYVCLRWQKSCRCNQNWNVTIFSNREPVFKASNLPTDFLVVHSLIRCQTKR